MDNDWIVFGIPFGIITFGTLVVLGGEGLHFPLVVTASGLGVVVIGILILAGALYRLPEPEGGEEAH